MKKSLLALNLFLLGPCLALQAQTNEPLLSVDSRYIQAYMNIAVTDNELVWSIDDTTLFVSAKNNFLISNLGLGFSKINEKGWYKEISLNYLSIGQIDEGTFVRIPKNQQRNTISGEKSVNLALGVQLEAGKVLTKYKTSWFKPSLGVGLSPFIEFLNLETSTGIIFPIRRFSLGTHVNIVPELNFLLNKNLSLNLSAPVSIASISIISNHVGNLTLPEDQQTEWIFETNAEIQLQFAKIGLFYRLPNGN